MRNAGGNLTFYVLYQAFSVLKHFAVPHPSLCIAIYMAANTIIEIMKLNPEAEVRDGYLKIQMNSDDARKSKVITDGLYLHLSELQSQYPNNLKLERGVFDA